MVQKAGTAKQQSMTPLDQYLLESFNVTLINHDKFRGLDQAAKQEIDWHVFNSPIEELLFSTTGLDAPL